MILQFGHNPIGGFFCCLGSPLQLEKFDNSAEVEESKRISFTGLEVDAGYWLWHPGSPLCCLIIWSARLGFLNGNIPRGQKQ